MIRLTVKEIENRVQLVKEYMELEGSYYSLEDGIVKIPKLKNGKGYRKESVTKQGYRFYSLRDKKAKKNYTVYLHHIVMILADPQTYIEQMSIGMTVNHKDGNKANNSLSNLEYMTQLDNFTHAYVAGLYKENALEVSIREADVYNILRAYHVAEMSVEELSEMFGLSEHAIKKIVKGRLHRPIYMMFRAVNADLIRKEKPGNSKLSEDEVKSILRMYHIEEMAQAVIAERYNIGRSTVAMITTGQRWKEIYKEFTKQGA